MSRVDRQERARMGKGPGERIDDALLEVLYWPTTFPSSPPEPAGHTLSRRTASAWGGTRTAAC